MGAGDASLLLDGSITACMLGRRLVPAGTCSTAVLGGSGGRDGAGWSTSMLVDPNP